MLKRLAERYFAFVGKRFPVMCASDEFHFVPRAEAAADYYGRLDNLEADSIGDAVKALKKFQKEFSELRKKEEIGFEEQVDLELLAASAAGLLIELENKESFRTNPLLYLKIAFIGLDHALNKPAESSKEAASRVSGRLQGIPALLEQGRENLSLIPESLFEHAIAMAGDCREYLANEAVSILYKTDRDALLGQGFQNALEALDSFKEFLMTCTPLPDSHFSPDTLQASLSDHFRSTRSLDEIFDIAVNDWHENLDKLEETGKMISPNVPWQELYQRISPGRMGDLSIISRYRQEAEKLADFFEENGLLSKNECTELVITETPVYLRSVRASASFGASLTADSSETDFFYITTHRIDQNNPEAGKQLAGRLHREYKFLTAHETVPGHYLLDSVRRKLRNPVRRQIESPLFYEGWAAYAETLLADCGYVTSHKDLLTDFRRRLWRAARCQIDAGLATGKLGREEAVQLLKTVGFSRPEAESQISRYGLNPGYQLCYCLGNFEIRKIRDKYISVMGDKVFHTVLLEGGEIPFQLVEKRMENAGG